MQDVQYPVAAVERTMKVQEIVMRAMSKQITWWQAGNGGGRFGFRDRGYSPT